jgi:hypothetical protein
MSGRAMLDFRGIQAMLFPLQGRRGRYLRIGAPLNHLSKMAFLNSPEFPRHMKW